ASLGDNSLGMQKGVDFKPVSGLKVLNDVDGIDAFVSVTGANVTDAVELVEGANANNVALLPIQIMNNNNYKRFAIKLNADGTEALKGVTYYSVYNYKTTQYLLNSEGAKHFALNTTYEFNDANSSDLLIVIYADTSSGVGLSNDIEFAGSALNIRVEVDAYTTIK
ncbi:MAG: hypothetical protein RR334_02525, partial [Clostridia bacterium]